MGLKLKPQVRDWIRRESYQRTKGISFIPHESAPDDFASLMSSKGSELRIWSGFVGGVVYGEEKLHQSVRAWHDHNHIRHELDFSVEQEIELARIQAAMWNDSDVLSLAIWIDYGEQTKYRGKEGDFPTDAEKFFESCWDRLAVNL